MKKGPIIGNAVILIFFLFLLLQSLKLQEIRRFGEIGSGFWPIVILGLASLLSVILLLSSWMKRKGEEAEESASADSIASRKRARRIVVISSVATLVYIFAMQWVGFALATLFYILAFIVILGERRKWVLIFSPVLVTVFILVVFSKFIAIPFPRGIGIFAELSRFFF
jgi:putative tricarboxylic transport membrane protein